MSTTDYIDRVLDRSWYTVDRKGIVPDPAVYQDRGFLYQDHVLFKHREELQTYYAYSFDQRKEGGCYHRLNARVLPIRAAGEPHRVFYRGEFYAVHDPEPGSTLRQLRVVDADTDKPHFIDMLAYALPKQLEHFKGTWLDSCIYLHQGRYLYHLYQNYYFHVLDLETMRFEVLARSRYAPGQAAMSFLRVYEQRLEVFDLTTGGVIGFDLS